MSSSRSALGFLPTHRVPVDGLATYPEPDPAAPPGPRVEASLDVQVLEQREDGWAELLCSNGWKAWSDGRLLEALPRFVPASGMLTFSAPDPALSPGERLDGGLDVSVIEQRPDGWARVLCSNGWSALGGRAAPARGPYRRSAAGGAVWGIGSVVGSVIGCSVGRVGAIRPARSRLRRVGNARHRRRGVHTLASADRGRTRPGRFAPPLGSGARRRRVPVDISYAFLFRVDTNAFPHIGLVGVAAGALILLYAAAPLVTGRLLPRRVLFAGSFLAVDTALLYFGRWLHPATGIGVDIGPFLVLAGGVVAAVSHFRTRPVGARGLGWI